MPSRSTHQPRVVVALILVLLRIAEIRRPDMRILIAFTACVITTLVSAQSETPAQKPPSKREQRLQKTVDEMIALVEKHSGLEFKKRPTVRATKHKEWRGLVQRELEIEDGLELFQMSVSTMGLYVVATDEIVLSPIVVGQLTKDLGVDPPRHVRTAIAHQKATIAHEIVHALQELHYGLPSRLKAAEDPEQVLRYKFVIEGHAVLIEERIAERELGLEDFMVKGPYSAPIGGNLSYVTGWRYFRQVLHQSGRKGVHEKLKDPPTYDELVELARRPLPRTPPPEKKKKQA